MNSRNRLPGLVMGIVLLAGCQSLEIPQQDARTEPLPAPGAGERSAEPVTERVVDRVPQPLPRRIDRLAMTIPRPNPPQVQPLTLERALPEPEIAPPRAAVPARPAGDRQFRHAPQGHPVEWEIFDAGPFSGAPAFAQRSVAAQREAAPQVQKPAEPSEPAEAVEAWTRQTAAGAARGPAATPPTTAAKTAAAPKSRIVPTEPVSRPAEVQELQRELVARKGDPISVDLEGSGWIYTGLKSGEVFTTQEDQGIDFLSRQSYPNRTSFNFKAVDYGEYELTFQYQDHRNALVRSQVVQLQVVSEPEFAAAVQRQAARQQPGTHAPREGAAPGVEPVPGPPVRSADSLFDLGEYDLALIEYMRNMRSGDSYLNDRIAQCYERTGEYLAAVKYYRENLGLTGEYGERAALGLVRSAVATEDSHLLLDVLPTLFSLESVPIGSELLAVARFQTENRRFPVAIQALEKYIRLYPEGRNLDEVYFRLAQIYEVDSPYRDLESARHYYGLLYESFPESIYVEPAARRLNYLDRHFFLVQ
jgi:tetratricopeptide (TPR) repeat protein